MSVACYTDRVMTCFLQAKNAKPKPMNGAPRENRAVAAPGLRALVRWIGRRVGAAGLKQRSRAYQASPRCAGTALPGARGQKAKTCVDRRSTRVFAFPWRSGPTASNRGRKPAQLEQLSRIPGTAGPSMAKTQVERKIARRSLIFPHFCVCRLRRARGKQPSSETSVAGAAIPDSWNGKARASTTWNCS